MKECNTFAETLVALLSKKNIDCEIIRIDSSYGIYSDKAQGVIGINFHYGVRVGDIVYDNITTGGLNFTKWLDDMGARELSDDIIKWSVVKEIFKY